MTRIKILPLTIAAILFVSAAAFAQEMKPLVQMDNSTLQAQAWLSRAIDKNSTYSSNRSTTKSISNVKFDGCRLSYKIETETNNSSYADVSPGMGTKAVSYNTADTTLAFDLGQMNIGSLTMTPLAA